MLANAEIKTMINAFGCGFSEGYGNDFDITKLRYDKIIIMADADVDGAHISTLLLTLFYRFMPELIYEGHVYIAMPPLYKVIPSRGQEQYLYDDKALEALSPRPTRHRLPCSATKDSERWTPSSSGRRPWIPSEGCCSASRSKTPVWPRALQVCSWAPKYRRGRHLYMNMRRMRYLTYNSSEQQQNVKTGMGKCICS